MSSTVLQNLPPLVPVSDLEGRTNGSLFSTDSEQQKYMDEWRTPNKIPDAVPLSSNF